MVLDNVCEHTEEPYTCDRVYPGQRVRSQDELERIIKQAGLKVRGCSGRENLNNSDFTTVAWVMN